MSEPVFKGMSPREVQIMKLIAEGAQNKVIAARLNMAEATVKVHLKSVLRKLRLQNRTQLAVAVDRELRSAPTV